MGSTLKRLRYRPFVASVLPVVVVALCMLALFILVPSSEAGTTGGGTYKGMTSQGQPGSITTPNGRRITASRVQVSLQCTDGVSFVLPVKWKPMPILPTGKFAQTLIGQTTDEEGTYDLTARFTGRFNSSRTSVTAKAQVKFVEHFLDGTVITCESGPATLRAQK